MVEAGRYAVADVFYPPEGGAVAALLIAADATFGTVIAEHVATLDAVAGYRPGHFADRELPAPRSVMAIAGSVNLLVVDGYVDLDPLGRPGLGRHAHGEFGVPVIGVAKTAFRSATHAVAVCRGAARSPLYVTAAGMAIDRAADLVGRMSGPHRLPDALRRVDALSRSRRP
ncbi:endonuclease V [Saccharomonospora sp. NPDC046836]|uniref:endonuclease V n=1 Tax=Saccharomonospora sp. NPDC046836 TaxID=3156921 RepID=UPI0034104BDC